MNPSVVVSSCGGLVFFLQPFAGTAFLGSFLVSCLPGGILSAWRYLAFLGVSCFRGAIVFWWFLPSSRVSCLSGGVRRLWVVSCPFGVDFFPSGGVSYLTGGILAFWQVCGLSDCASAMNVSYHFVWEPHGHLHHIPDRRFRHQMFSPWCSSAPGVQERVKNEFIEHVVPGVPYASRLNQLEMLRPKT